MGKSWKPPTVTLQHTTPSSYIVSTPDGSSYRRYGRHPLKTTEAAIASNGPPLGEAATPLGKFKT